MARTSFSIFVKWVSSAAILSTNVFKVKRLSSMTFLVLKISWIHLATGSILSDFSSCTAFSWSVSVGNSKMISYPQLLYQTSTSTIEPNSHTISRLATLKNYVLFAGPRLWDDLPSNITSKTSLNVFSKTLKKHMITLLWTRNKTKTNKTIITANDPTHRNFTFYNGAPPLSQVFYDVPPSPPLPF